MRKAETLESLTGEWAQLLKIAEEISNKNQQMSNAVGHWSVSECLMHLVGWDKEVVDMLETFIDSGHERGFGPVHHINERFLADKKYMNLAETWNLLHETHLALASCLKRLPEELFDPESYIENLIGTIVVQHYRGHRKDIATFSKGL